MEDILASIRRIIADDQSRIANPAPSAFRRPPPPAAPVATPDAVEEIPKVADDPQPESNAEAPESAEEFPPAEPAQPEPEPVSFAVFEPEPLQPQAADESLLRPHLNPPPMPEPEHDPALIEEIASAGVASILRPRFTPAAGPRDEPAERVLETPHQAAFEQGHTETSVAAASTQDVWLAAADPEPLVSPAAGASIESSFQALAQTVLLQNTEMVERMMRDMLRPMLKTWLDDNLPTIVERLVRAEIERVARGGR